MRWAPLTDGLFRLCRAVPGPAGPPLPRVGVCLAQIPPPADDSRVGVAFFRPCFGTIDGPILLASVRNVTRGVVPDGRLGERGSDAYQEVLLATGGLNRKVPSEVVFRVAYLPGAGGR